MTRAMTSVVLLVLVGCAEHSKSDARQASVDKPLLAADPRVLDVRGGETVCEIHKSKLIGDIVPIWYGYPGEDLVCREYPHARTCFNNGCEVYEGVPTRARVLYCPECRKAYAKDCAEHGWIDPGASRPSDPFSLDTGPALR